MSADFKEIIFYQKPIESERKNVISLCSCIEVKVLSTKIKLEVFRNVIDQYHGKKEKNRKKKCQKTFLSKHFQY